MKRFLINKCLPAVLAAALLTGCQKGNLEKNPNVADETGAVPAAYIFNHVAFGLYQGGGALDGRTGNVFEGPFDQLMRWNQFTVSNYNYYRGNNVYNWTVSATAYDMLKYAGLLDARGTAQYTTADNIYSALAKYFRAYAFIWLSQRVGDIPVVEAGDPANLTPKYNTQHDVYKLALQLLDDANTSIGKAIKPNTSTNNSAVVVDGDIYGLTWLQWQKVINTYRLRVLISLSKRADDNADLGIKTQFAAILADATKYPIMTGNADNLTFKYTSTNQYPHTPSDGYNIYENIGNTYLNITTATQDPRTFLVATPAPAQVAAGKAISDFTAYVGANISLTLAQLNGAATAGSPAGAASPYSFLSYKRYFASTTGSEPYIMIGYPEMCFNIAEAINRGWATGTAATWYTNGINASLNFYGLTNGQSISIGDLKGTTLGTVTANTTAFLANVAYAGDNATGLAQILNQKYVAFFENSGWEAFYNFRRTGIPAFAENGPGIGTASSKIPRRWQYPVDEKTYNTTNVNAAIQSQYGGSDDVTKDMWLVK